MKVCGWSIALTVLVLGNTVQGPTVARGQGTEDLRPRFGETTKEFEARTKGLPPPVRTDPSSVSLDANVGGHFLVQTVVNGTPVRMLVDTGASLVVLSEKDARQIGFRLAPSDFNRKSVTANGVAPVAPVLLHEVAIGDIAMSNVQAVVIPETRLSTSLLGMSFLSRLSHFEVRDGRLTLKR